MMLDDLCRRFTTAWPHRFGGGGHSEKYSVSTREVFRSDPIEYYGLKVEKSCI